MAIHTSIRSRMQPPSLTLRRRALARIQADLLVVAKSVITGNGTSGLSLAPRRISKGRTYKGTTRALVSLTSPARRTLPLRTVSLLHTNACNGLEPLVVELVLPHYAG